MPTFCLLHASDFHLASLPYSPSAPRQNLLGRLARFRFQVSHDRNVLEAFARFVYVHRTRFDAVVVTGDLSTTGYRRDLQRAYQFFANPATQTFRDAQRQPTLAFVRPLVEVLPGNHDRYRRVPGVCPPGGTEFDNVFGGFWYAGQGAQVLRGIGRQPRVLLLVGADFSLPRGDLGRRYYGIPGWYGQGRVTPGPLQALVTLTRNWRTHLEKQNPGVIVLWAIHFDPHSTDETLKLLDSEQFAKAATVEKIPVVLCGHTHESKVKPISDTTAVCACGSTTQAHSPQGNDFQVIEVNAPDDPMAPPSIRVVYYRYDGKRRFRSLSRAVVVS